MVTKLCDFMLQQKSPKAATEPDPRVEMFGSTRKPAFSALVALASHLIRCMRTSNTAADASTFAKRSSKDKTMPPQNMVESPIEMPAIAIEYFTNRDLFKMIMTEGYSVVDYSKALAHLCHGSEELSRYVLKTALEFHNENKDHPSFLYVLRHVLKLNDLDHSSGEPLQPKRLEWVFGTPQPRYKVSDDGLVLVGLQPFYFDIRVPVYTYSSPLWENKEDRVSLLKLVAEEYEIEKFICTVPKVGAERS